MLTENEVVEEFSALSSSEVERLAELAKNDLYFMAKGVLMYPDITPETHGAFCRFVQNVDATRRMILMPRGHLKSTICTIADSIRLVVRNPEHERVLIAAETHRQATSFLREIKNQWQSNRVLRGLYPELVPPRFMGTGVTWTVDSATLVRNSPHKEAHWTTAGVGGAIVGFHFTRIKADDLVGMEAIRSPAKMRETKDWIDTLEPLLIDLTEDVIDFVGTRWAVNDLYAYIMKVYGPSLAVFRRQAIENGEIIFPKKFSMEYYTRLQEMQPHVWFAQFCNNPIAAGVQELPPNLIKAFSISPDLEKVIYKEGHEEKSWRVRELDRVVLVDPNSGNPQAEDTAAILCVGVSPEAQVFVLETWSGRPNPEEFVDRILAIARRWRPRVVGIEVAGQQNTDFYMRRKMQESGEFFFVQPVRPRNRNKMERIRFAVQPLINGGKLFVLPTQEVLRQQIADFPNNFLVDELDALAYGPELWRTPLDSETMETDQKNVTLLMARRSTRTGY